MPKDCHPGKKRPVLVLLSIASFSAAISSSSAFSFNSASVPSSPSAMQHEYPRPLHPGGFSLPPLVEDRLPIVTSTTAAAADDDDDEHQQQQQLLQADILLIRPPDMESLWEWYAYTKNMSDGDPSWARVWPTALSLARFVLRSLKADDNDEGEESIKNEELILRKQAINTLKTASHVVEVGCGLGVAGLTFASAAASADDNLAKKRTITFLDREQYALHCVMASASTNSLATGPINIAGAGVANDDDAVTPGIVVRAAIDDWTLPTGDENNGPIKNVCYRDLHLESLPSECYNNPNTVLLASDILYEPSSMTSLAIKLQSLLHPTNGGYALIADPKRERTPGCRDAFVKSVKGLGGRMAVFPMPNLDSGNKAGVEGGMGSKENNQKMVLLEGDIDIDGNLAETVLIVVYFGGTNTL